MCVLHARNYVVVLNTYVRVFDPNLMLIIIAHNRYMEFRYVMITFDGPAPTNWSLSAWSVAAPWDSSDTGFASSNPLLNRVWELCRHTLQAGVTDTYSDSNTRERRPYEADGIIAAASRLLLQRNTVMWARHSHSWVLAFPTWPIEWAQITPFLAYQDYMATGLVDLAVFWMDTLHNNTKIGFRNASNGLLETDNMGPVWVKKAFPPGIDCIAPTTCFCMIVAFLCLCLRAAPHTLWQVRLRDLKLLLFATWGLFFCLIL